MMFDTTRIEELTVELSSDPFNPFISFNLAEEYREHDQLASAVTFYTRCVEYGYEKYALMTYTSLLRLAECFETQKDRQWTVSNALLQAIAYNPNSPEAWFYLSRYFERQQQWQESYTYAVVGLTHSDDSLPLPAQTDYLGEYCLLFQKATAAWWIGHRKEAAEIFTALQGLDLPEEYRRAVESNLARIS